MDSRRRTRTTLPSAMAAVAVIMVLLLAAAPARVGGDFAADRAECSDSLAGLATCLTYVQAQATAAAPTPDCCAGLRAVLQTSRKCLCVLVKDRDDPNLGLKLNVTKALGLPAVCKASANISDCPRLLNLAPGSKDAQVFEEYAKQEGTAPATASGGGGSSAATASPQKNGAAAIKRWLGVGRVGDGGARAVPVALALFATLVLPFLLLIG